MADKVHNPSRNVFKFVFNIRLQLSVLIKSSLFSIVASEFHCLGMKNRYKKAAKRLQQVANMTNVES